MGAIRFVAQSGDLLVLIVKTSASSVKIVLRPLELLFECSHAVLEVPCPVKVVVAKLLKLVLDRQPTILLFPPHGFEFAALGITRLHLVAVTLPRGSSEIAILLHQQLL